MSWFLTKSLMNFNANVKGPLLRQMGQACIRFSLLLDPLDGKRHRILPTTHNFSTADATPDTSEALFVAPTAFIRGDVVLGAKSVVNFNSTLETIKFEGNEKVWIGQNTVIQDLVLVKALDGGQVNIGDNTVIGANSIIENSQIGDNVFIGPGSRVINSKVAENAFLAAGTRLVNGQVESGQVACGPNASSLREINGEEREFVEDSLNEHLQVAIINARFHSLTPGAQREADEVISAVDFALQNENSFNTENAEIFKDAGLPWSYADFNFGDFRSLTIQELSDRRMMRYKEEDYEGVSLDQRPKDIWGSHQPSFERILEVKQRADSKKDLWTEPGVGLLDRQDVDIQKEIRKKRDPQTKF